MITRRLSTYMVIIHMKVSSSGIGKPRPTYTFKLSVSPSRRKVHAERAYTFKTYVHDLTVA